MTQVTTTLRKKIIALAFTGAAAMLITAVPNAQVSAADIRPPRPAAMQQAHYLAYSHRLQDMVRDGKISEQQALKLNKAVKKFHAKQAQDRKRFMKSLPERTGISQDTLKELFAPPRGHRDRDDWDD